MRNNKMKKILLKSLTSLSLLACTAFADENLATKQSFEGFYIGTGLGYLTSNSQIERKQFTIDRKASSKMSGQAPQISLFAGYGGCVWSSLYAGIEGKFSYTNFKGKYTQDDATLRTLEYHIRDSYGLAGRLGWNLKNAVLVYAKAGILSSAMRLKMSENLLQDDVKKRRRGIEIGLGADFAVTNKFILGAEFTHTRYQSIHACVPNVAHYKVEPQTNVLSLRASYKF